MNHNPYGPPQSPPATPAPAQFGYGAPPPGYGLPPAPQISQTPLVLASIGCGVASLYWLGMSALIAWTVSSAGNSAGNLILPIVLIALYAYRAVGIWRRDVGAVHSALYLHAVGGVLALFAIFGSGAVVAVLQGIKVAVHIFGGIAALAAKRALAAHARARGF